METDLAGLRIFPFTYNGIENANPNPGYNFQAFIKGQQVAVEFQVHARDFTKKNSNYSKDYTFRMQSAYLIELPKTKLEVSTPTKRHQSTTGDEWLVTPPRTKKSSGNNNPLEWRLKPTDQANE